MDWAAQVDIYCERLDPSFWAEPLNALSNLAFILAGFWAAREAQRRHITQTSIWVLIVLAFCIGIGSFLFHTFATAWSGAADVVPIWLFVLTYIFVASALVGGTSPRRTVYVATGVLAAVALAVVILSTGSGSEQHASEATDHTHDPWNGSQQYFPAVIAMFIFSAITLVRGHPIRWWFTAATGVFLISLSFRTVDIALCDAWPYGTHIFWHLLNGTTIALLLQALIRHKKAPL